MIVNRWWQRLRCARYQTALSLRALGLGGDGQEQASLDAHLTHCPRCRTRLAELEAASAGLRRWADSASPAVLPEGSTARWQARIREMAGATTSVPTPSIGRAAGRTAQSRSSRNAAAHVSMLGWLAADRGVWGGIAACWLLIGLLHWTAPESALPPGSGMARGKPVSLRQVMLVLTRGEAPAVPEPNRTGTEHERPDRRPTALPRSEAASVRRAV